MMGLKFNLTGDAVNHFIAQAIFDKNIDFPLFKERIV